MVRIEGMRGRDNVLLRESNRLLPSLRLAVDVSGNLTEEDEVVLLQSGSQFNSVVVVIILHGIAKGLVVLLLDQQIVDRIVDGPLVLGLDVQEERLNKREVV